MKISGLRSTVFGLLGLGIFQGCALGPQDAENPLFRFPVSSLEIAQLIARQSEARCEKSDQCPPQVAMLVVANPDAVGWCTGSLVEKDLMVTNAHCIPEDIRKGNTSCDGRIFASFPSSGSHGRQLAECSKVEYVSFTGSGPGGKSGSLPNGSFVPDVAYFRLISPVDRGAFSLSPVGFKEGDIVTIPRVNPEKVDLDRFQGTLSPIECAVDMKNHDGSRDPKNAFITFKNCPIRGGNSGSPLLIDNEARGVVFAAQTSGGVAIGTNFACLGKLGANSMAYDQCKEKLWIKNAQDDGVSINGGIYP